MYIRIFRVHFRVLGKAPLQIFMLCIFMFPLHVKGKVVLLLVLVISPGALLMISTWSPADLHC